MLARSVVGDQSPRQPSPPRAGAAPRPAVYRLFGVTVAADADPGKDDLGAHEALRAAVAARAGCRAPERLPEAALRVVRKSFDARPRRGGAGKAWSYVVDVAAAELAAAGPRAARLALQPGRVEAAPAEAAAPPRGGARLAAPPGARAPAAAAAAEHVVVVGGGPAGLFAALALAEAGARVTLLERGRAVERRGADIGALFARRLLSPDSNLCFGEGGAGTWSDGKLTTRVGRNADPVRRVLAALVGLGAPPGVLVAGKPHLGTDRLVGVLRAFRARLAGLGADVRFGARVRDLVVDPATGACAGVVFSQDDGEGGGSGGGAAAAAAATTTTLRASRVVLATGHSARDVYALLAARGVAMAPKPFAVGFRIEHPQAAVDALQYGAADAAAKVRRGRGPFPVADYRLATSILEGASSGGGAAAARGAFSFCMCPGGQIVPTSTDPAELCLNGMSFSRRSSPWANSALVAAVGPADWAHLEAGHGPLAAVELQRRAEREAAARGGGGLVAPVQAAAAYAAGGEAAGGGGPPPASSYRLGVRPAPLGGLFEAPGVDAALRAALARFEAAMPGFASHPAALLHGAETRTSAPVRVERRPGDLQSPSLPRLYPCGEGAGHAGGIVSAAVDGLRVGEAILADMGALKPGEGSGAWKPVDGSY